MLRFACIIILCILVADGREFGAASDDEHWKEFEDFLFWKKTRQLREYDTNEFAARATGFDEDSKNHRPSVSDSPPINDTILMARYVVNQAEWAAIATISVRDDIQTFPVTNAVAFSDGPLGNGSGIPYMYITPISFVAQDLAGDHRASLLITLAQGSYCKDKNFDPIDPRCARVTLSGKVQAVEKTSEEYQIAKKAVFTRHPWLKYMPKDHQFFFAKLNMIAIILLDYFGGAKYIAISDYLHPPVSNEVL